MELGALDTSKQFMTQLTKVFSEPSLLVAGNQVPTYFSRQFPGHGVTHEVVVCSHEGELTMRGLVEHVRGNRPLATQFLQFLLDGPDVSSVYLDEFMI